MKDETDSNSDSERESDSETELECDVSNVEITEELRQYFEQTEKHREELSKCLYFYSFFLLAMLLHAIDFCV